MSLSVVCNPVCFPAKGKNSVAIVQGTSWHVGTAKMQISLCIGTV